MSTDTPGEDDHAHDSSTAALAIAAIGIVYGDIGTSPLYAIRESINEYPNVHPLVPADVLGILSLIFWSLIVVIAVKYIGLVLEADNDGEGGIIALTALISPPDDEPERGSRRWVFMLMGLFGAALLWGDSMITPAISVVSAVEGLEVAVEQAGANPAVLKPYVIPITIGILVALFFFQKRGTAGVGAIFGPITSVWFLFLGFLGISQIVDYPAVFRALNPVYAAHFFSLNGFQGLLVLGSVFLVVTGGEALYADIGHFGTFPIRLTWFGFVMPALLLNYFGQGALILEYVQSHGGQIAHPHEHALLAQPFFHMSNWMPSWVSFFQVGIATAATIIASQAVISGAFSLTRQAVQLGYLPRLQVEHTSEQQKGQIFMPAVNWALMIACIGLVIGFSPSIVGGTKTSSNLAAAYGVAVTTDMVFTTILFVVAARLTWQWSWPLLGVIGVGFLFVDLSFWGAMIPKIPEGGWFPLVVAGGFFIVMTTWKRGRKILGQRLADKKQPYEVFFDEIDDVEPAIVPGTAIYMDSSVEGTPHALQHNLEHNRVLHERVVVLTVQTSDRPYVSSENRYELEEMRDGFHRMVARYGFAEDPEVPKLFEHLEVDGEHFELEETTFFLGRENLRATDKPGMALWREKLFALMSRNARRATSYFRLPPDRVIEVGTQIRL